MVLAAHLALAAVKELVNATEGQTIEAAYTTQRKGDLPHYRAMLRSDDAAEGPRAFSEKRPPRWQAR
jgi:crotonobetainyl-CoA hydratase